MFAYSFSADGIYYNIVSSALKTVSVTYRNTSYDSYVGDIIIPSNVIYNGVEYKVTSISRRAFYNSRELTSVILPNTITGIDDEAFYFCSSLKSVVLPLSVKALGESAFFYCTSMASVTLNEQLEVIGDFAFKYCKSLTSIRIPKTVTVIGNEAFSNCSGITSFVVEDGNAVYDSRSNCNALIDSKTNTLIMGTRGTIEVPASIVAIGASAFYNMSTLTSIVIHDTVEKIGAMAFAGCSNIAEVKMPNSVTTLERSAFKGCLRLKSIVLSNRLTQIPDECFWGCAQLASVDIPNSVTKIGSSAFQGCTMLGTVVIPESVTSISIYAFQKCDALKDVYVYTRGEPLPIAWSVFNTPAVYSCSLHVRRRYAAMYEDDSNWGMFGNIRPFAPIMGDADSNEVVDKEDLKLLSSYLIGEELDYIDLEALDLDGSGTVSIADLTLLVKMLQEKTLP